MATPSGNNNTGGPCLEGHYCPTGSADPQGCEAGTYNDHELQSECFTSPAGYYCVANSTAYIGSDCPTGHYCLNGTRYATEYPCPAGTFTNETGTNAASSCATCPAGEYCATPGLSETSGPCVGGFVCAGGASSATPTDNSTGWICPMGSYCPTGSSFAVACTPGQCCVNDGLSAPTGNCTAGYYCTSGASSPTPVDGVTGNVCPAGSYCP